MFGIQGSFLNQLLDKEEDLDYGIVTQDDELWEKTLLEWDICSNFSLDIETFGVEKHDGLNPWKGEIRLIQIGLSIGKTLIVDLGPWNDRQDPPMAFMSRLEKHLMGEKNVIGVNLKFDLLWLKVKFGIEARHCHDLMLMSQILWAGLPVNHSLKAIASRLNIAVDKTEQMSEWGFQLTNQQLNYAARDAQIVFSISGRLQALLLKHNLQGSASFENIALPCFVQMEYYGMPVDLEHLNRVIYDYEKAADDILKPFKDKYSNVNPDAPQQVLQCLRNAGLDIEGTMQNDLSPYWHIPEIKALSLWRTTTTIIDYLKGCKESFFDNAVRGVYRQINPSGFGRSTCGSDKKAGRLGVNLQNPPNQMPAELDGMGLPKARTIFKPLPGYSMLIADLSSAHARIATEISGDARLIQVYNSGEDLHSVTASGLAKIKGLDWDATYINKARKDKKHPDHKQASELRVVAKPVFFGSANCQGSSTLKKTVKTDAGMDLSESDAKDAIKGWRTTYAGLYKFQQDHHKKSNSKDYTFPYCNGTYAAVRGASGRRVFMEKRKSDFKPDAPPEIKISDCCSFVWTSCEADIIKGAMGVFLLECDKHPEWEARICNMCHDEVDVVCRDEHKIEVATWLQACMRSSMALFIKSIPPDDMSAKPESLVVDSWADK